MPLGQIRALLLLHDTFRHHPATQRLHILGRYLSTPFLRTLDSIPRGSRVLDIGAGHGTLARLMAEQQDATVFALEPDLRKTMRAYRHPRVRFIAGYDDCVRGSFDAVVIFDVLYLMPPSARDALFARAFARLRDGGTFVVKDLDPSGGAKSSWNRAQETISVGILHLSRGGGVFANDSREVLTRRLELAGFCDVTAQRIDRWYPHAHIVYTGRKPQR